MMTMLFKDFVHYGNAVGGVAATEGEDYDTCNYNDEDDGNDDDDDDDGPSGKTLRVMFLPINGNKTVPIAINVAATDSFLKQPRLTNNRAENRQQKAIETNIYF